MILTWQEILGKEYVWDNLILGNGFSCNILENYSYTSLLNFSQEEMIEPILKKSVLKIFNDLRQLCREREQLVQERTMLKNQLHAERTSATSSKNSVQRTKKRIALIDLQEKEIREEIERES